MDKKDNYEITSSGMEYVLYEKPIALNKIDAVRYFMGGVFVVYESDPKSDSIMVWLHAKIMESWDENRYLYEMHHFVREGLIPTSAKGELIDVIPPYKVDLRTPHVMNTRSFFRDENSIIRLSVQLASIVYNTDADKVILCIRRDRVNRGIAYYGYYIDVPGYVELSGDLDYIEEISYKDFKAEHDRLISKSAEDIIRDARMESLLRDTDIHEVLIETDPDILQRDDAEELIRQIIEPGADIKESIMGICGLPKITGEIRDWLSSMPFSDFRNYVTSRVKGQEETVTVVVNIYNYLECIAYGRQYKNNIILAAPSGCGKTETYRAVRDYFAEKIPELCVCQVDLSSVTEAGYKGNDPGIIIEPLKTADNGIGIVFLDEFDKKVMPSYNAEGGNMNLAVQGQLLTLIEGTKTIGKKVIDTGNTMFIGLGAFDFFRKKRKDSEKSIGFGKDLSGEETHYDIITSENMISVGASYELLGRFSSVINYHRLSDKIIDEIVEGMVQKVSRSLGCPVVISDRYKKELHKKANSNYGCRLLESAIRNMAIQGYKRILEENLAKDDYLIRIDVKKGISLAETVPREIGRK
ncbi:MAG: AAA family ATPase [Lachnospiraceae bacterium]|nr:AAA family ATPase [Lachnospiraceae bacterium]